MCSPFVSKILGNCSIISRLYFAVLAGNFLYTRLTWWFENAQFNKNTIQSNSTIQQEHQQQKCFGIVLLAKPMPTCVCVYFGLDLTRNSMIAKQNLMRIQHEQIPLSLSVSVPVSVCLGNLCNDNLNARYVTLGLPAYPATLIICGLTQALRPKWVGIPHLHMVINGL